MVIYCLVSSAHSIVYDWVLLSICNFLFPDQKKVTPDMHWGRRRKIKKRTIYSLFYSVFVDVLWSYCDFSKF